MSKVKYIDTDEYVESPRIIFRHCKYIKSVIIDNDVLANCFNNCQGLESIIINLTRPLVINDHAFANCPALKKVIINNNDEQSLIIGDYAFHNCPSLSSFDFCRLESIKLRDIEVGDFAFINWN